MAGRPSKLTPRRIGRILRSIAKGNTYRAAASAGGISVRTLLDWRQRGEAEEERLEGNPRRKVLKAEAPYLQFMRALTRVEEAAEERAQAGIQDAIAKDWRAAAWWLERRRKVEYGPPPRESIHMEGRVGPGPEDGALEFTFKMASSEREPMKDDEDDMASEV